MRPKGVLPDLVKNVKKHSESSMAFDRCRFYSPLNSLARWAMLLEEYEYTIEHRVGIKMQHVDALTGVSSINMVQDSLLDRIARAQNRGEGLQAIIIALEVRAFNDYLIKTTFCSNRSRTENDS